MFDSKKFIQDLNRFEVHNPHDMTMDEIRAMINDSKEDGDPLWCAVWNGFQCGCMKAGGHG
jgi:hypothetical protein